MSSVTNDTSNSLNCCLWGGASPTHIHRINHAPSCTCPTQLPTRPDQLFQFSILPLDSSEHMLYNNSYKRCELSRSALTSFVCVSLLSLVSLPVLLSGSCSLVPSLPFSIMSYRTKCRILGLEVGAGEARNPCVIGRTAYRLRFCLHRSVVDGCWSVASSGSCLVLAVGMFVGGCEGVRSRYPPAWGSAPEPCQDQRL